ncbi:tyrosine-type recombinase/integrase [Arthrobacter sp. HLT1-21]
MAREALPVGTWGRISRTKQESGQWRARARFRDADGVTRRVEAAGSTAAKAERNLTLQLRDRSAQTGDEITDRTRVSQLMEIWFEELRNSNRRPQTVDEYERLSRATILPAFGQLTIREVTVSRVTAFVNEVAVRQNKPALAKNARVHLKQIMQVAVRHDVIATNPVSNSEAPKKQKKEIRTLDEGELRRVRRAVREWRRGPGVKGPKATDFVPDVVDMFLATGVRIGEVLAIRWDDVDLESENPTVTISGTLVEIKGLPLTRQPLPKSKDGHRVITLPRFAVDMLLRRRVEIPTNNFCDAVFPSSTGSWYYPNNFHRQWRAIRAAHNLDWVTPHVFRKTVATLIERELDAVTASKVLGHADEKVTIEHYIERRPNIAPDVSSILQRHGPVGALDDLQHQT